MGIIAMQGRSDCARAISAGADQMHRRREGRSRRKFVGRFRRTSRRTPNEEDAAARDEDVSPGILSDRPGGW